MQAPDLLAVADELEQIKDHIDALADRARQLVGRVGPGPIRDRAKAWLGALDRATGAEPTTTIDDTIEEVRAAVLAPAPLGATR